MTISLEDSRYSYQLGVGRCFLWRLGSISDEPSPLGLCCTVIAPRRGRRPWWVSVKMRNQRGVYQPERPGECRSR